MTENIEKFIIFFRVSQIITHSSQ